MLPRRCHMADRARGHSPEEDQSQGLGRMCDYRGGDVGEGRGEGQGCEPGCVTSRGLSTSALALWEMASSLYSFPLKDRSGDFLFLLPPSSSREMAHPPSWGAYEHLRLSRWGLVHMKSHMGSRTGPSMDTTLSEQRTHWLCLRARGPAPRMSDTHSDRGADFTPLCSRGRTGRGLRWRLEAPLRVPCSCLHTWIILSWDPPCSLSSDHP